MTLNDFSARTKGAVVVALLGFVISVSSTSTSNIRGVYSCTHIDYAAIALGGIALAMGGGAVLAGLRESQRRPLDLGAAGIAALIGVWHLLRGLNMVASPC